MTNEELVERIQAGESELCIDLWEQVERLVAWKAIRVMRALKGFGDVEFGDLYNSCYPAMIEAIKTYTPANGAFTTWFGFYIKTAFAEATGNRLVRTRNDPIREAVSLSLPIGEEDGELSDITPDPKGELGLISCEAKIMYEQIQREISLALLQIPPTQERILYEHYFEQKTIAEIGHGMGITANEVESMEHKAIRTLRKPSISKNLRPLYEEFDFWGLSGAAAFRNSGMSVQERYLIMHDNRNKQ